MIGGDRRRSLICWHRRSKASNVWGTSIPSPIVISNIHVAFLEATLLLGEDNEAMTQVGSLISDGGPRFLSFKAAHHAERHDPRELGPREPPTLETPIPAKLFVCLANT